MCHLGLNASTKCYPSQFVTVQQEQQLLESHINPPAIGDTGIKEIIFYNEKKCTLFESEIL